MNDIVARLRYAAQNDPLISESGYSNDLDVAADLIEASCPLMDYWVAITVEQLVEDDELDEDDREDAPSGKYAFELRARGEADAREQALDEFHETHAIHTLDHFDISTEVGIAS